MSGMLALRGRWLALGLLPACTPLGGLVEKVGAAISPTEEPDDDPDAADDEAEEDQVAPTCPEPNTCISLAEASSRGEIDVELVDTAGGPTLKIFNHGSRDICIDAWVVLLSNGSQDAIAGHDPGSVLSPGAAVYFYYGAWDWEGRKLPWYCIEHNQYTAVGEFYTFNGALAPDALLDIVYRRQDSDDDGTEDHFDWGNEGTVTQEYVWSWLAENPTVVVGRANGYLSTAPGLEAELVLQATNLGREPALGMVTELVPAELEVIRTDRQPTIWTNNPDGTTTLVFAVKLDGAIDSENSDNPAIYDTESIPYTVRARASCTGRTIGPELTAEWPDASGETHLSAGQGLVVECCDQPGVAGPTLRP